MKAMSSMKRPHARLARSLAALAGLGLLVAWASCSHDSYLVLNLRSGDSDFTGVAFVEVTVTQAGRAPKLLSPDYDSARYNTFSSASGPTLSVSFSPDVSGTVDVDVVVKDINKMCLGRGNLRDITLVANGTTRVAISIKHTADCTATQTDGGTDDSGTDASGTIDSGVTFPGCDPANAASCPSGKTCFVDCTTKAGTCVAGGNRGPGESCSTNSNCMPGTQCFDFSGISGCSNPTRICMKFCASDGQCLATPSPTGDAGAPTPDGGAPLSSFDYPGGSCQSPVVCSGGVTTSYRTCNFVCDPRGDGKIGCPSGLTCFLYRDRNGGDSPDCGCREPSRTGTDGMACTSSVNCAPGFICNQMSATSVCRRLCSANSTTDCGTKTCTMLTNNVGFGVCL